MTCRLTDRVTGLDDCRDIVGRAPCSGLALLLLLLSETFSVSRSVIDGSDLDSVSDLPIDCL